MVQTCTKCSRANPAEAVYCYFDGFVLAGHSRNGGGPVAVGSQPFANPFVFPTGRVCRSFDELALACQEDWDTARDLLQQGYLESFLGGLGRVDLALAARETAKFPDRDRGLDQLLTKLPSEVLAEPRMRLEPLEVNLGVLNPGDERQFDLHLENQGMRLLYGSVTCADNVWLTLGEGDGGSEKLFQFTHEQVIPVHVRRDRLRAGNKPAEAKLLVESNGGVLTVVVRADVPVKAFPGGVLAGAKSPRQVAEKAKANPKEAAPLFEKGAVAEWYKDNGWVYPVQGPSASGLGAVQQFFEALGLTPPPKVDISEREVALEGNPGDRLTHSLEVKTLEKRPVYAHAVSNVPWLEVSPAKLNGRFATINFSVPNVPNRPGEVLSAKLTVQSNGNQRFIVPVNLQVGGSFDFGAPEPAALAEEAAPVAESFTPTPPPPAPGTEEPEPRRRTRVKKGAEKPPWLHAVPAGLLALALLGVVVYDLISPRRADEVGGGGGPSGGVSWTYSVDDPEPLLGVNFNDENQRFGLEMLKEQDPQDPDRHKKLTFKSDGSSSNTCLRIDGADMLFGQKPQGYWVGKPRVKLNDRQAYESVMIYTESKVKVTQHVEIVPGEQSRLLDTCLVYYTVENAGTTPHKVGLRVMLDTFIGANDGVPFVIPGKPGLMDTQAEFGQKDIPDYIEALEKPDLKDPGTVARLGLKGFTLPGVKLDPITTLIVCRWPGNSELRWDMPKEERQPIKGQAGEKGDSCVFLYWAGQKMQPGDKRELAFTYGLGKISVEGASQVGLTAGGSFNPGGVFTVTAYVKNPKEDQKVKLILPPGLDFADGGQPEKAVTRAGDYSQVSWRVKAGSAVKTYTLEAVSENSKATYKVRIKTSGIFGG